MKVAGIILIVIQVIALFGSIASGAFATMGIVEMIGFFIPSIIGIILIVAAKKREK
ncbi:MAG: hypothetical protein ACI4SB_09980 [Acutalibacteraceae bacterium]